MNLIENYFNDISPFHLFGSYDKGTDIVYSDIDYLYIIDNSHFNKGYNFLFKKIKEISLSNHTLSKSFPSFRINDGEKNKIIDITPCIRFQEISTPYGIFTSYLIYNKDFQYQITFPQAYKEYLNMVNHQFQGRLLPFIRNIKYWKYNHNLPISSFYLEIAVSQYFIKKEGRNVLEYSFIESLIQQQFKAIIDPLNGFHHINAFDN